MRAPLVVLLSIAIITGGVFIYKNVFAVSPVMPATGGTNVSIDTTSNEGSGAWTTMSTNIAIQEANGGDIKLGIYRVSLPAGWEFDTNSIISIASDGLSLVYAPVSGSIVPHATYFEFRINGDTGSPEKLILQNLRVRPTGQVPLAAANMYMTCTDTTVTCGIGTDPDAVVMGVGGDNFGTLSSVVGAPAKTYIETAIAGSGNTPQELTPQSLVAGQSLAVAYSIRRDQFNNFINNYAATWTTESETGGVTDADITPAGDNKSATFTSHLVGTAVMRASVSGTTAMDSALITVTPAAPGTPTAAAGPLISAAEQTAGVAVIVPLGTSGAIVGDILELLLDDSPFTAPITRVLDAADITATQHTFTVASGQLGADGAKGLTAKVTDNGNVGPQGASLSLTLDTAAPSGYGVAINTDPVNNVNQTAFSFTFSGAEVGATYNYSIDDTTIGSPITGSGVIATTADVISGINVSTLDDDTLTLTVTLTDPAGNTGANATDTVTKDTVAPVLAEVTPVTNPINTQTPSYTFSSTEAGAITYGGSCSSAMATASSGNNAITFSTLIEAAHNDCTITVTDATGNISNVLDVSDFTVDITSPAVSLSTTAADPTNVSPIPVTAEFSENVSGFVVGDVTVGNGAAGNFVAVDGNTYTFDVTPSGQGAVTVDVAGAVATDAATNGNTAATQLSRVYDSVAPAEPVDNAIIPNLSTSVIINAATDSTVAITGTVEANATVTIVVDGTPSSVTTTANGTGVFGFTNANLVSAGIAGGSDYTVSKVVKLKITDAATNSVTTTNGISYTRDTVAPSVNAGTDKNVNAQATQDATVSDGGSGVATYSWTKESGSGTITFGTPAVEDTTISANADDTYTIKLTVTDNAGNSAFDTISFKWDTTAPTVALSYNPVSPVGPGTLTITATYSEPIAGTPQISINQPGTTDITNAAMTSSDQTVWTYDYTVNTANGGEYVDGDATVSLSAINDPAGNAAGAPANTTFVIDTGAPSLTVVAPVADQVIKTTNGTVAIDTTIVDATAFTCAYKVDAETYQATACDGDIVNAGALTDGRHTLTIKATDNGGNFTEASVSIVIDSNNDLTVGLGAEDFTTIQAAVNKTTSGDSVTVAEGTYAENVVITSRPNITIQGVGVGTVVEPASGIGFAITSSNGITIQSLKIHTTGTNAHGVWVSGGTAVSGLTVKDDTIIVDGYSAAVYGEQSSTAHSGWLIGGSGHPNIITINSGAGVTGDGLDLHDVSGSEVSYNTITLNNPTDSTNVLWTSELSNISNLIFSNNTVSGSSGSEIVFLADFLESTIHDGVSTGVSAVTITGNTFNAWGSRGLRIGAGATGVTVNNNAFLGTGIAIKNEDASTINAESNWFGDTDPSDNVDPAVGAIDYSPWYGANYVGDDHSSAWTWYAGGTMQDAVDAASASDIINVTAGTYTESVTVDKALTIQKATTAPTVNVSDNWAFKLTAADITIDGFNINITAGGSTNDQAIRLENADSAVIKNNTIITSGDTALGIWACGSNNGCNPSDNVQILSNTITVGAVGTGIYLDYSNPGYVGWLIGGNGNANTINATVVDNSNPIEFYDAAGEISYNTINGRATGGNAITVKGVSGNVAGAIKIKNNTINGGGGSGMVFVGSDTAKTINSADNEISGNTFSNWKVTDGAAIRLTNQSGATVSGFKIFSNTFTSPDAGVTPLAKDDTTAAANTWDDGTTGNTWSDYSTNANYPVNFLIFGSAGAVDHYPTGRIDAGASTIGVNLASQTAGSNITVTVTAKDASSNNLAGVAAAKVVVEMTPATGNTITQPVGATDVNGQTTGTVSSTKAEGKTVSVKVGSATIGWVNIIDTEEVSFTPAAVATLTVTTAPNDNPITTVETAQIIVTGTDTYGNVVTNDAITQLSMSLPIGSGFVQSLTPTAGGFTSGVFTATLTPVSSLPGASVTVSVKAETTNLSPNINGVLSGSLVINDGTAPQVTTAPSVGASNVSRTIQPELTFSEVMATSTFSNIQLRKVSDDSPVSLVGGAASVVNDTQARIEPASALDYLTQYYYYIPATVTDSHGVAFVAWTDLNKSSHTFTTENHELDAPYVTNWTPADGSKDIAVNTTIILNLNEKLNLTANTDLSDGKFKLRKYAATGELSTDVAGKYRYNGDKQVIITPNSPLTYGTQYFIHIMDTVIDLVGNSFGSSWQFTNRAEHEFTTIQGMTVQVYAEKTDALINNAYVDGWRYRYEMTLNTTENGLSVAFPTGWQRSGGGGEILPDGNMRLLIDEANGGSITGLWSEGLIADCTGSGSIACYDLSTDHFDPPSDIDNLDSNPDIAGRQIVFYVFTKIPDEPATPAGIYTANYNIETSSN